MQIHSVSQVHGPQQISAPHAARIDSTPTVATSDITDTVDISETGRLLEMSAQLPDIRLDRVNQIRAELAEGVYESGDKLDVALERLLDEIA